MKIAIVIVQQRRLLKMAYTPTTQDTSAAYQAGFQDGAKGECNVPTGSALADIIFAPIDILTGGPSTQQYADATAGAYIDGNSAGAASRK
jgi:hypothetical protein